MLFPIVFSNYLIALYRSQFAFYYQGALCYVSFCVFAPPLHTTLPCLSLSLPPALGLYLFLLVFDLLLFSPFLWLD